MVTGRGMTLACAMRMAEELRSAISRNVKGIKEGKKKKRIGQKRRGKKRGITGDIKYLPRHRLHSDSSHPSPHAALHY